MATEDESCSKGIKTVLANTVRAAALAVWGTQPRDSMLIAEMSVSSSIGELVQAENATKKELSLIVDRVRATQSSKSKNGLKDLLLRSRVLRGTLASMGKKRMSMEKQLETLRQSQLNQHMLVSMKHTSEALQTMGLKVSDADNIMLDLEESNSDINALQSTLSTSFGDEQLTDSDLSEELALILSDDSLEPMIQHAALQKPKSRLEATEQQTEQKTEQQTEQQTQDAEAKPDKAEQAQEQKLLEQKLLEQQTEMNEAVQLNVSAV
jgi:hypothetical protein